MTLSEFCETLKMNTLIKAISETQTITDSTTTTTTESIIDFYSEGVDQVTAELKSEAVSEWSYTVQPDKSIIITVVMGEATVIDERS